jgi:hypothetical protein
MVASTHVLILAIVVVVVVIVIIVVSANVGIDSKPRLPLDGERNRAILPERPEATNVHLVEEESAMERQARVARKSPTARPWNCSNSSELEWLMNYETLGLHKAQRCASNKNITEDEERDVVDVNILQNRTRRIDDLNTTKCHCGPHAAQTWLGWV